MQYTIERYWQDVARECRLYGDIRRPGQNAFNVLAYHRPDLAEQIRGTDKDPFYSTLPLNGLGFNLFGVFLMENW